MKNIAASGELPVWVAEDHEEQRPLDRQEGGSHYDLPIQPLEYIHANGLGYIEGNIIKYATRHKAKNGAEDVKKIIHYCCYVGLSFSFSVDQAQASNMI